MSGCRLAGSPSAARPPCSRLGGGAGLAPLPGLVAPDGDDGLVRSEVGVHLHRRADRRVQRPRGARPAAVHRQRLRRRGGASTRSTRRPARPPAPRRTPTRSPTTSRRSPRARRRRCGSGTSGTTAGATRSAVYRRCRRVGRGASPADAVRARLPRRSPRRGGAPGAPAHRPGLRGDQGPLLGGTVYAAPRRLEQGSVRPDGRGRPGAAGRHRRRLPPRRPARRAAHLRRGRGLHVPRLRAGRRPRAARPGPGRGGRGQPGGEVFLQLRGSAVRGPAGHAARERPQRRGRDAAGAPARPHRRRPSRRRRPRKPSDPASDDRGTGAGDGVVARPAARLRGGGGARRPRGAALLVRAARRRSRRRR